MAASAAAAATTTIATPFPAGAIDIDPKKIADLERENMGKANTNGAPEKHIPQVKVDTEGNIEVSVPHVMDPEKPHYIMLMWLKDVGSRSKDVVVVKAFPATDPSPPTLKVRAPKGANLKPLLYCNLHGLWEGEEFTV